MRLKWRLRMIGRIEVLLEALELIHEVMKRVEHGVNIEELRVELDIVKSKEKMVAGKKMKIAMMN